METHLSKLLADAGAQVSKQHQQEAAQKQAQEQAADPLFQLEQEKVGIQKQDSATKAAEVERKRLKDLEDAKTDDEKIDIDRKKVTIDAKLAGVKIDNQKEEGEKARVHQSAESSKKVRADIAKEAMKPKPTPSGDSK